MTQTFSSAGFRRAKRPLHKIIHYLFPLVTSEFTPWLFLVYEDDVEILRRQTVALGGVDG